MKHHASLVTKKRRESLVAIGGIEGLENLNIGTPMSRKGNRRNSTFSPQRKLTSRSSVATPKSQSDCKSDFCLAQKDISRN